MIKIGNPSRFIKYTFTRFTLTGTEHEVYIVDISNKNMIFLFRLRCLMTWVSTDGWWGSCDWEVKFTNKLLWALVVWNNLDDFRMRKLYTSSFGKCWGTTSTCWIRYIQRFNYFWEKTKNNTSLSFGLFLLIKRWIFYSHIKCGVLCGSAQLG